MTAAGNEIGSVRLNAGMDGFIIGDEILVGTTWNDVVPIPEPSTALLLAVGALALAGWRASVRPLDVTKERVVR